MTWPKRGERGQRARCRRSRGRSRRSPAGGGSQRGARSPRGTAPARHEQDRSAALGREAGRGHLQRRRGVGGEHDHLVVARRRGRARAAARRPAAMLAGSPARGHGRACAALRAPRAEVPIRSPARRPGPALRAGASPAAPAALAAGQGVAFAVQQRRAERRAREHRGRQRRRPVVARRRAPPPAGGVAVVRPGYTARATAAASLAGSAPPSRVVFARRHAHRARGAHRGDRRLGRRRLMTPARRTCRSRRAPRRARRARARPRAAEARGRRASPGTLAGAARGEPACRTARARRCKRPCTLLACRANAESLTRCQGTGDPDCWGESHGKAV